MRLSSPGLFGYLSLNNGQCRALQPINVREPLSLPINVPPGRNVPTNHCPTRDIHFFGLMFQCPGRDNDRYIVNVPTASIWKAMVRDGHPRIAMYLN